MRRVWHIDEIDERAAEDLSQSLNISRLLAKLLVRRHINTPQEAREFLVPTLSSLADPCQMKGMDKAVERLVQALCARERICVWGDYDVDGITSTSLLIIFFRALGVKVDFHIPSRLENGYGLNIPGINRIEAAGVRLLITVDCGISDLEAIQHARRIGLDVIILDHHQIPEKLPPALAILNPHQPNCSFPCKELAAVGVTFNLLMALRAKLRAQNFFVGRTEPNLREFLDLVALGTIGDVVSLLDENRIITHFGLVELAAGRRPGIAALKEVAGLWQGPVSRDQVAFRLAPRINAIGRLSSAAYGVELLTTNSYTKALTLARELDQANSRRKLIEETIYVQALNAALQRQQRGIGEDAIVLDSDEWHVGVVGIVASRLVERFLCPVVLIVWEGDKGRGSARGVEGVHLSHALSNCKKYLLAWGGHCFAAGLSIRREEINNFRKAFCTAVKAQNKTFAQKRIYHIDAEAQPCVWNQEELVRLKQLEPHGPGNPRPIFIARNLEVKSARVVGKKPPCHLKGTLIDKGHVWDIIGFRMADLIEEFRNTRVDVLYTPEFNTWEGHTSVELHLHDVRRAEKLLSTN